MNPKFVIGTSFFNAPNSGSLWFFNNLWRPAVQALHRPPATLIPSGVFCIHVARNKSDRPFPDWIQHTYLTGDLGHVHQLIGKKEPFKDSAISSYEASMLTLALIAYTNECDLIYLEQDCLAFGKWIEQLYAELGSHTEMLFGKVRCMPCAQSLFIVKHKFLLTFVCEYIQAGNDIKLGEEKFISLMKNRPNQIGQFSFGFDRDRPLVYESPVFYAQKLTRDELLNLRRRNLVKFDDLPENVEKFTNDTL